MEVFRFKQGRAPLLVSMPHVGTHIPDALAARMTDAALELPDTDWHLEQLYDFLGDLGASVLVATHSRYVIDLNRPPDDANLYPGQDTTGLIPVDTFASEPVYRDAPPDNRESAQRIEQYWRPYHDKLRAELAVMKAEHGYALLWDAHSIASRVPRFFDGRLPDLNLGTAGGTSCSEDIEAALWRVADRAQPFSAVLNGRFKGGHITRAYGRPDEHVHAVQLEMAEAIYMNESHPYAFRDDLAEQVRPVLRELLQTFLRAAKEHNI